MRIIALITLLLTLSYTFSQAQKLGTKKDTVYYNSFDEETVEFKNETLYNEAALNADQRIINGALIFRNSNLSSEVLKVPIVTEEESSRIITLDINHEKSNGSILQFDKYRISFEEKGLRIIMYGQRIIRPSQTFFKYNPQKDSTTLIFDLTYNRRLVLQVENLLTALDWNLKPLVLNLELKAGTSFALNSLGISDVLDMPKNVSKHNFNAPTKRWKNESFKSSKVMAFSKIEDNKFVVYSIEKGQGGYSGKLYASTIAKNEKTDIIIGGALNDNSNFKLSIDKIFISVRNGSFTINKNLSKVYTSNEEINLSIKNNLLSITIGDYLKNFAWDSDSIEIKYHIGPNSKVEFDNIFHFKEVPKTFEDVISDSANKKVEVWKVKDAYEKTDVYNHRVSKENLRKKKEYFEKEIINGEGVKHLDCNKIASSYDPDKDLFTIDWQGLNRLYLKMPPSQAKIVNNNFCNYSIIEPEFKYENEKFYLLKATLIVNNQTFYLTNNPNSNLLAPNRSSSTATTGYVAKTVTSELKKKTFYLLVIANQEYIDPALNDLSNPISDGNTIINTLTSVYNFRDENVTFLENASRTDIFNSLDKLQKTIESGDNLLIYYAGHGHWDKSQERGYWLPVDAKKDNRANWFSNADLKGYIAGINTKHTLLISDACFSGSILNTTRSAFNSSKAIAELYNLTSRQAITSGTLNEAVPDNSVFAKYLNKWLLENPRETVTSQELFSGFRTTVINNSPSSQKPQFGNIRETGGEGGEFIFIKK